MVSLYVVFTVVVCVVAWVVSRYTYSYREFKAFLAKWLFRAVSAAPMAKHYITKSKATAIQMLVEEQKKLTAGLRSFDTIPTEGLPAEEVMALLRQASEIEESNKKGVKYSGAIYSCDYDHNKLIAAATSYFAYSNVLHPDIYVCVRRMEAEIIRMTANLMGGADNPDVCGLLSSGGTESIILAVKAHRDYAIKNGKDPNKLEMIVADSAHCAYKKAAHLMHIRLIITPVRPSRDADVRAMLNLMNKNTILLVASAPSYPHGVVDDVVSLGRACKEAGVGLHVDACLGGFVLPFARNLGYPIPPFDLTVPGVTSLSCDTHKYGYSPKGTSVVLFASQELRSYAFFTDPDWPGGMYGSATLLGSRPGSVVFGAWASLIHKGISGYMEITKKILETATVIIDGMRKMPNVVFIADPEKLTFLIPFTTLKADIFRVAEALSKKHWVLNVMQSPNCVHLCLTEGHIGRGEEFLECLRTSIEEVEANPSKYNSKAPFYASAALIGDREVVGSLLGDILAAVEDTI